MNSEQNHYQPINAGKEKEGDKMNTFPDGWNEEKVQSVINYYRNQTEEEEVSEDEAPFKEKNQTFVEVPQELVPEIRKLIASYKLKNNNLLDKAS